MRITILLIFMPALFQSIPVFAGECRENLFTSYKAYRGELLKENPSIEVLSNLVTPGIGEMLINVKSIGLLKMQEQSIKTVYAYYYSCNDKYGRLYLKIKSNEPEVTRALVQFNKVGEKYKLHMVSLENKSVEKYFDQEGVFQNTENI